MTQDLGLEYEVGFKVRVRIRREGRVGGFGCWNEDNGFDGTGATPSSRKGWGLVSASPAPHHGRKDWVGFFLRPVVPPPEGRGGGWVSPPRSPPPRATPPGPLLNKF